MVKSVFLVTQKCIPYSCYKDQSLFLIMKLQMWKSVRGRRNTTDLVYNVVKVKLPFYAPHVISYITKQDTKCR